eukprot:scaffold136707_cov27-Tisochrysis_lutea.AAC.1
MAIGLPVSSAAAAQSSCTFSASRPITETMPEEAASDAACIASPRALVIFTPSSKEMAPAKASAVYSPSESPHATFAASIAAAPSSPEARNFSTAAIEATKIAGCDFTVVSSSSLGPSLHSSSRSYPRISDALAYSSAAAGTSAAASTPMPTTCAGGMELSSRAHSLSFQLVSHIWPHIALPAAM